MAASLCGGAHERFNISFIVIRSSVLLVYKRTTNKKHSFQFSMLLFLITRQLLAEHSVLAMVVLQKSVSLLWH